MFEWLLKPYEQCTEHTHNIAPNSGWIIMKDLCMTNPSGRALALTLACYTSCDRAPPEMHPSKMFEILGHPHFKQLHGHKIPMNATNSPDRLNLYIFSLNLSYHSFVSVHDIQQKRLLNKISVYAFTHPGGHHRVANAMLSVACTCDGYRNWPRYGLRWNGWYCNPEQHELCRPSRGRLRPAQRVLFRIAVPTTTAQTV